MSKKSHMSWSWVIIVSFFVLGVIDMRFGILGMFCMGAPIYHAVRGRGKIHCVKYCPRGSFLGKFLDKISIGAPMPKWMTTKRFKNLLLVLMLSVFSLAVYHSGGDFRKLAGAFFRFMGMSFIVGILIGIVFKPRSWCTVCPMGHATHLIKQIQVKNSNA
ncbi:4Fe-4S ferredoxin [Fusibacter sp. JL298sf-3]